jgi:hypothetical protein
MAKNRRHRKKQPNHSQRISFIAQHPAMTTDVVLLEIFDFHVVLSLSIFIFLGKAEVEKWQLEKVLAAMQVVTVNYQEVSPLFFNFSVTSRISA